MITRRDGERVRIPQSALVAGKVVPAAPARRRGPAATYPELARVTSRAWRPVESERLGEWELRAAGGFTRRANSVLPLGDPGLPLDAALAAVRRWYGERGLPAYVQTATGAEGTQELLCAELERRGWVREVTAELWIGPLAPVADRAAGAGVVLSRTADEAWLGRYQRKGVSEVALRVLGTGPSVWFASVPGAGEGEPPAAIGRCVVDGRWAGFAAVEVDPGRRRQGLATEVMAALARRALEEGASAAWLQVETDNESARALYGALGFAPHHAYHHYRAPEERVRPERTPASADRPSPEAAHETGSRPRSGPESRPLPEDTPDAPFEAAGQSDDRSRTGSAPDGLTQAGDAPGGTPGGLTQANDAPDGTPDDLTPASDAPGGTPDGLTQANDAPDGTPDGLTQASDTPGSTPDGLTQASDAPGGTPDGLTQASDTPGSTPDSLTQASHAPRGRSRMVSAPRGRFRTVSAPRDRSRTASAPRTKARTGGMPGAAPGGHTQPGAIAGGPSPAGEAAGVPARAHGAPAPVPGRASGPAAGAGPGQAPRPAAEPGPPRRGTRRGRA